MRNGNNQEVATAVVVPVTIEGSSVKAIRDGLAAIVAAQTEARRRKDFYSAKVGQRNADDTAAKQLESADPEDDAAVLQAAQLAVRAKLWPAKLMELERDALLAGDKVGAAQQMVRAGLGAAASEIVECRREFVCRALKPLQDEKFAAWVAGQWPLVGEAVRFQGLCNGEIERTLDLPLETIAETVLSGQIPPMPPPPDLLREAALIRVSMEPMPAR